MVRPEPGNDRPVTTRRPAGLTYPDAVAGLLRTPGVVIDDTEIVDAHEGGTLPVALTAPLDTHDDLAVGHIVPGALDPRVSPAAAVAAASKV
jgi:malate dehydrogenase (oxaloacetate-decarboxylating)